MKDGNEIIIDLFGIGHAVAIKNDGKLIDFHIDPPNLKNYYPGNSSYSENSKEG